MGQRIPEKEIANFKFEKLRKRNIEQKRNAQFLAYRELCIFVNAYFRNVLQEHDVIQSVSRKGNCYDNCIMETFFGRLKNEMYYGNEKENSSFEEFSQAIEEYIDYYNNKRIQAKTKWMPPVQYRIASMCST